MVYKDVLVCVCCMSDYIFDYEVIKTTKKLSKLERICEQSRHLKWMHPILNYFVVTPKNCGLDLSENYFKNPYVETMVMI